MWRCACASTTAPPPEKPVLTDADYDPIRRITARWRAAG
jgi:hypothetical protein